MTRYRHPSATSCGGGAMSSRPTQNRAKAPEINGKAMLRSTSRSRAWLGSALSMVLLVSGCASGGPEHPLRGTEKALGTDSQLNWSYHRLVEDPDGFGLRFPGFIIGIEKSKREIVGVPPASLDRVNSSRLGPDVAEKLEEYLDDGKRTFISHIVETRPISSKMDNCYIYNVYPLEGTGRRIEDEACDVYQAPGSPANLYGPSFDALDALGKRMKQEVDAAGPGNPYTHVLFLSMGWHTPQQEALRNYNSLVAKLHGAARAEGKPFRPLFVGLTWPSTWRNRFYFPKVLSYFNKAHDADEVGFIWGNYLLHEVLLPLKKETGLPVTVLGHSFGARIVSRALFSGQALGDRDPPNLSDLPEVDLFVALQGAFSANRFLPERKKGREGAPYRDHKGRDTLTVLTWSQFDQGNPVANRITSANHVGGSPGYERATDERYEHHFQHVAWDENGNLPSDLELEEGKILYIDAKEVVKFSTYRKGGHAHNDIYRKQMGWGLWKLMTLAGQ